MRREHVRKTQDKSACLTMDGFTNDGPLRLRSGFLFESKTSLVSNPQGSQLASRILLLTGFPVPVVIMTMPTPETADRILTLSSDGGMVRKVWRGVQHPQ